VTVASVFSLLGTSSRLFDLPVFWPFLMIYFFMLVGLTVKRHLRHMSKYGYKFGDFNRKPTRWDTLKFWDNLKKIKIFYFL